MTAYPEVRLGQVLTALQDRVVVEPDQTYRTAGIYSFGKGLFPREPVDGVDTRYATYIRLHTDQFVYSRLFAWEGAVAVVPPEFDGLFVSQEFPTFEIDRTNVEPRYLHWLCRWARFHEQLAGATKGLGLRRQRVHTDRLLLLEIPLPSISEQRRLIARLDALLELASRVQDREAYAGGEALLMLYPALVDAVLARAATGEVPLGEYVDVVSDIIGPGEDPAPASEFVGLQHVERHTGRLLGSAPVDDQRGPKARFRPGDVLYPRLRPYLNKAHAADTDGLCSVDQYVLRPHDPADAGLLAHALRSRSSLAAAVGFTSSLQLPRIRKRDLLSLPVPNVPEVLRSAVERELEAGRQRVIKLLDRRRAAVQLRVALETSVLNSAFHRKL